MRQADVYYKEILAGFLVENEDGLHLNMITLYLNNPRAKSISLTFPLQKERTLCK